MSKPSIFLTGDSLIEVWIDTLRIFMERKTAALSPLVVSICEPRLCSQDEMQAYQVIDHLLMSKEWPLINTTANTIFPQSLLSQNQNLKSLCDSYETLWPRICKCKRNRKGTYFQRLVAYPSFKSDPPFNQLQHIIEVLKKKGPRKSALQAIVYDPLRDANHQPYQEFPCLQSITLTPVNEGFIMIAIYPRHYFEKRALGNYLGLTRLGLYIAQETNLRFQELVCYSGYATLELPKNELQPLYANLLKFRKHIHEEK